MTNERSGTIAAVISWILRGGVALSVSIITIGLVLTFVHHRDYFSSRPALGQLIDAHGSYRTTVSSVISGMRDGSGQAVVMVGILVLIATPVVRVAASIALFAAESDRAYVMITSVVLLLLLLSFVIGAAG